MSAGRNQARNSFTKPRRDKSRSKSPLERMSYNSGIPAHQRSASFDAQLADKFAGKYYEEKSPKRMRQPGMQDMLISDRTVERVMGPEPIPTLDIEMSEIQNDLQRKMVEEIQCVMCLQFPYDPLECKNCNKLFCKYC